MDSENMKVVNLEVEVLHVVDWNPNKQDEKTFNALVENIQELGMVEPILVSPKGSGEYEIVSGTHRYEACKLLGYTEIPCIVKDLDADMVKFQNVRMNVLKGKLDPVKFTKLFNEMADKYGEEMTKQMMAFVDDNAFKAVYLDIKRELPKELQEKLEEAKDEIKTVDDLSRVLNELFTKYGDTLDNDYMVFTYGGKTHLWVIMDDTVKKALVNVCESCHASGVSVNRFFARLLSTSAVDEALAWAVDE